MNVIHQKPILARPVVHIFRPTELIKREELGCRDYTSVLWNLGITGYPVLVKDTMSKILGGTPTPHVAFMGQSNAGKSTLINALLNQHALNRVDVNSQKQPRTLSRESLRRSAYEPELQIGDEDPKTGKIIMPPRGFGASSSYANGGSQSQYQSSSASARAFSFSSENRSYFTSSFGTTCNVLEDSTRTPSSSSSAPSVTTRCQLNSRRTFSARRSSTLQNRRISEQLATSRANLHRRQLIERSKLIGGGIRRAGWSFQTKLARQRGLRNMQVELKRRIKDTNRLLRHETVGSLCNTLKDNIKRHLTELNLIKERNKARKTVEALGSVGAAGGDGASKAKLVRKHLDRSKLKVSDEAIRAKKAAVVMKDYKSDRAFTKKVGKFMLQQGRIDKTVRKEAEADCPKGMTYSGITENPYFADGKHMHKSEYKRKKAEEKWMQISGGTGIHPHDRENNRSHLLANPESCEDELPTGPPSRSSAKRLDLPLPYSLENESGRIDDRSRTVPRGRELFKGSAFAPVSKTAGRTRQLFRFELGGRLTLVDLPGYGFAGSAGKQLMKDWEVMVDSYLEYMKPTERLKRIISLIDVSVGFTDRDEALWEVALEHRIPLQVVLTKCDHCSPWKLHNAMEQIINLAEQVHCAELEQQKHKASSKVEDRWKQNGGPTIHTDQDDYGDGITSVMHPYIHAVSALENIGMEEFRLSLANIARDEENRVKAERLAGAM
ncbi:unnamed protein product [Amoebophrya sp. A25]|nr:unnamed protein product [Amoebophrya sp. A25]|eukprot:GSA25T00021895001.1